MAFLFINSLIFSFQSYLFSFFAHFWFATVQDVLHADWQEAWHSPQPTPVALMQGF